MAGKTPEEQIGVSLPEREQPEEIQVEEQQDDRPEWLPEKFKDPSEFASSYKNLEAELTRRADEQRNLQAQIEQLSSVVDNLSEERQQPQQQQYQQDPNSIREQLMASYENDPIGTVAMLAQQYSNQTFDQRFQQMQQQNDPMVRAQQEQQNQMLAITVDTMMSQRHPDDWNEMKEIVAQEIERDPYLLPEAVVQAGPEATARALDRVYTTVKAQRTLEQIQNGSYQSDTSRMKMSAGGLTGGGGRAGTPTESEREADAIVRAAKGLSYSGFRAGH